MEETNDTPNGNLPACSCASNETGGDGLRNFEVDTTRRIKQLSSITERGWYLLEMNVVGPAPASSTTAELMEPRVGHSIISIPSKKEFYIIGGGNHLGETNEIWKIDYSSPSEPWQCKFDQACNSVGRYEFLCGLDKAQEKIWIFGGADLESPKNDVFYIDVNQRGTVSKTSSIVVDPKTNPNIPSQRTQGSNSCIVDLANEEYLVVFGGGVKCEQSVKDAYLYMFKVSTCTWKQIEVSGCLPTPIQGHGMVAIDSKVYVHGGMENMCLFEDFFMIDLAKPGLPKWNKIRTIGSQPSPRAAHGITAIGNEIYIFGGVGEHGSLSDLWKYHIEKNEWTQLDTGIRNAFGTETLTIPPRLDFAMTSFSVDMVRHDGSCTEQFLLIHGGMNIMGHLFDDFWVYPLSISS